MGVLSRRALAVGLAILLVIGGIAPLQAAVTPAGATATPAGIAMGQAGGDSAPADTHRDSPSTDQNGSWTGPGAERSRGDSADPNRTGDPTVRVGSADTADPIQRHSGGSGRTAIAPPNQRDAAAAQSIQAAEGDVINQTQTYARVPEVPGEVDVTLTYEIPDRVVDVKAHVPSEATVTETDGFERVNDSSYEWNGTADTATIRYRINPNRTVNKSGPEGADGQYISVDTGEWALVVRSQTPTRWRYVGRKPVGFNRTLEVAGPGAAGEELVYLGDIATFEQTAHNQTVTLAVPDRATMAASPIAVLDSMANASNALRVGDRDERVFVVAAPSGAVPWGVEGFQIGTSDMWVQSRQPLDTADNVWLHEYVHSRQSFKTTQETRWTVEAMATYYAAVLTLEQDRIGFGAFRDRLALGERAIYADVVLSDRTSWAKNANYNKGSLVAGRIDTGIRVETDRNQTLQTVFQSLNGYQQPVSQEAFLAEVEATGGPSVRNDAETHTETSTAVTMWNATTHQRFFGNIPARIGYALPPVDQQSAYRADSSYRTDAPVVGSEPIRLVSNETLTVDAVVENAGGAAGEYNATLAVNGTVVTTQQGQLAARSRTTVELSHTFTTPGRYVVSIDGDTVTVIVSEPAQATVTDVSVSSQSARQGETVNVSATVGNDNDIPATADVVFRRDSTVVSKQRLSIPPQSTTQVTRTIALNQPGTVSLSAGNERVGNTTVVEVTVSTATADPTRTPTEPPTPQTTSESSDGFTALAAGLALVLAALFVRRSR
ncbi:MAG: CARDB domain-containing protein [Haloarcula sp.]